MNTNRSGNDRDDEIGGPECQNSSKNMSNNLKSTMNLKDREPEGNSRRNSCQIFIWITWNSSPTHHEKRHSGATNNLEQHFQIHVFINHQSLEMNSVIK